MDSAKNNPKEIVVVVLVVAILLVATMSFLFVYSGKSRPLTVVESKSMQHSDDTSYIGIIDTGDMVVMRDIGKVTIETYVDGYQNGHGSFGSYGDVIIYYREGKNPVIHRAILWLDYDVSTDRWSSPALENYPADLWENAGTWDDLTGELVLKGLPGKNGSQIDATLNIDTLAHHSGYITKGDNNDYFDQNAIHVGLVERSELKAVAGLEIPWLGCIKLLVNHKNTGMIPSNSIPCLAVLLLDIIMFIFMISTVTECIRRMREEE